MPIERGSDDALLRSLGEFRASMDRMIGEYRARLLSLSDSLARPETPAPATIEPTIVRAPVAAFVPVEPASRVRPAPAAAEKPRESAEQDPRQRLDALAKHLDSRLRRSREAQGRPGAPAL
jgi:hypothetical protein